MKLYSTRLLGLSTNLANYPLTGQFEHSGEGRSRTCGSTISIGFNTDSSGAITKTGVAISACAVGQSSAAILAEAAQGKTPLEITQAKAAISNWLKGEGALPEWPGFDALEAALDFPGRHDALLLPWTAASSALSTETKAR